MSTPQPQTVAEPSELLQWWLQTRHWIDRHANKILLTIIVATVLVVAFVVMSRSARAKNEAAWRAFSASQAADDFRKVAEDHAGTSAEFPSRMMAARRYIQQGMQQVMTNRKASDENLENAKTQLSKLLENKATPKDVREEALLNMAICQEALSDGNLKPATEAYEQLLKEFPTTLNKKWVDDKLKVLAKSETAEFYTWFRKTNPSPEDRPKPQDIKPSEAPNVKLDGDDVVAPPSGEPAREMPAEGTAVPATTEKPAEPAPPADAPKPEGDKPAEAAKPAEPAAAASAEEKPAAETPAPAKEEQATEKPAAEAAPSTDQPTAEKPAEAP